jgi:hypothetical protein
MTNKLFQIIFIVIFLLFGCSKDEIGFSDSRSDYMLEYQRALDRNNIPYIESDGFIKYASEYGEQVQKIKSEVDEYMSSEVGTKFDDVKSTEYFRRLLGIKELPFRAEVIDGDDWTYWRPESEHQQNEIEMEVVKFNLDNRIQ